MPFVTAKSIHQTSKLQAWLLLASLLLVCALAAWSIQKTRINGPLYREIATSHALISDILPPPLYIVEPYLSSVHLAYSRTANQPQLLAKLEAEIATYREKKAEWENTQLPPAVRSELLTRSLPAADLCIELIEHELVPRLRENRDTDLSGLMARLEQAFLIHRESINRLAELGKQQATAVETRAEQALTQHLMLIAAALGIIIGGTFIASRRVSREISASVDAAVAAAEAVGSGQLQVPLLPAPQANLEIARILGALEKMRETLAGQMVALEQSREALHTAKQEAERASEVKGEFLSTVSHELRTPLNGVLGMLQVIDLKQLGDDDQECIATAQNCAAKLASIIGDMLLFADLRSRHEQTRLTPFNLLDCIRSASFSLQAEIERKGLQLIREIEPNVPMALLGDPVFLERALRALLENAVKFTPAGKITVRVTQVGAEHCPKPPAAGVVCLKISVIDNGPGLPPEMCGTAFEAFKPGKGRSAHEYGGTGLGLALAAALLESMHGKLDASNRAAGGAEFSLTLPSLKHDLEDSENDQEMQQSDCNIRTT